MWESDFLQFHRVLWEFFLFPAPFCVNDKRLVVIHGIGNGKWGVLLYQIFHFNNFTAAWWMIILLCRVCYICAKLILSWWDAHSIEKSKICHSKTIRVPQSMNDKRPQLILRDFRHAMPASRWIRLNNSQSVWWE